MLTPPSEGSIRFCGEELTKMNESKLLKKRSQFQMIFQDPFASLDPRHTVRTILEEPVIIHKIVKSKKDRLESVKQLMNSVGIDSYSVNKKPGEFSGGQRQRIGIARALYLRIRNLSLQTSRFLRLMCRYSLKY